MTANDWAGGDPGWAASAAALGYLLGSIPFGLLLTRLAGAGDLRQVGSGNIGATNVLRTGHKGLAAATLLLDLGKGWLAVWLAEHWWPGEGPVAAAAVFLGHCYPVWLRFRGGKGVATLIGLLLALQPVCALVFAIVWLAALALARISSVGGIAAAASAPVSAAAAGRFDIVPLLLALALLVLWKHRANVERLLEGTEPRVGSRSPGRGDG